MCIVHQWHELDWISEYAIVMPPAVGRRHTTLQMIVHMAAWIARSMGITVIYTGNDVELCSERVGGTAEMCYIEAWNFLQQISCSLPAIGVHPLCELIAAPVIVHDMVVQARYWQEQLALSAANLQMQGCTGGPEMHILDDTSDDPHRDISQLDVYKRIRKQTTLPHIVNYQYHAIPVSRKGIVPALGIPPVIDLKHVTLMPRNEGCFGLRKIFKAVKSGLEAEQLQRKIRTNAK